MEKIENLNVYFNGDQPVPNSVEIILREGKAATPLETINPLQERICGDIDTVMSYVKDRFEKRDSGKPVDNTPIIIYCDDPDNVAICLYMDSKNPLATEVFAKLEPNPDLKDFNFNKGATFTNKSFIGIIRENAHCFSDFREAKSLVKQLSNFQATFETQVEDLDDKKGNTSLGIRTVLDRSRSGIPEELHFNAPLFNGGPKVPFTVEVEIEVTHTGGKPEAKFGFVSMDIAQIARDQATEIINTQIDELSKYFTCIRSNKV